MLGMDGIELDGSTTWPVVIMVVLFMAIVVVVLLNLLIAIMGDSYGKVKESERVEALRERAQIIVEAERTNPHYQNYHQYMHFVEAAESPLELAPQEWEGVTGRIKQLLDVQERRVDANMREIQGELDAKLDANMREIQRLLTSIANKVK